MEKSYNLLINMSSRFWLLKSEPNIFSIGDLQHSSHGTNNWNGVRNYQARNFLRDDIKVGDGVLFYHSSIEPVGIAGEAIIVRKGYPDKTAFDPTDIHYDPKSDPKKPTWFTVDIKYIRACKEIISLRKLKSLPSLKKMKVVQRGMRLSVQPVTPNEWVIIMNLPEWGS